MLLVLLALPGCGIAPAAPVPRCEGRVAGADAVWLLHRGMHLEIILPAAALGPALPAPPPGTAALGFGFGKRSFMRNEAGALAELLLGVLPGEGVVEVTPLPAPPQPRAERPVWLLGLPPGGAALLQRFLADSLARPHGAPRVIERLPGGRVFYAAVPRYSLAYTCNTWVADGLQRAGLPVRAEGVLMAGDVLQQLGKLSDFCALELPNGPRIAAAGGVAAQPLPG